MVHQQLLLSLLLFSFTMDLCWSECEQVDNWWKSFDSEGWSTCRRSNQYITGFYRGDRASPDHIYRLDNVKCCDASTPYEDSRSSCDNKNWWSTLDSSYKWATCPDGHFLNGLYRSRGYWLSNIEEAKCCKPVELPTKYGDCKDTNIGGSFDWKGWSYCGGSGYFVVGFYKGSCNELHCIEKLRCCKMYKVDGGWSWWGTWGSCSKTCGGGRRRRSRSCTSPPPRYGGERCVGSVQKTGTCNTHQCPDCLRQRQHWFTSIGCNFDKSTCGFVQDNSDNFDWIRQMGSTETSNTGPTFDRTTGNGYYMYIETSSPRIHGEYAKLNTPKLRFCGNMCLQFYYHMYGADMGTLYVMVNGNRVFTASGDKGDLWLKAAVDVTLSGMYAVTFVGIRGTGYKADIAIDDLLLASGYCS